MELNIYNGKEIIKTYKEDEYYVSYGATEDILKLLDGKDLSTLQGDNQAIFSLANNLLFHGLGKIKPILKDIFQGLTDEEIAKARTQEISEIIYQIITLVIEQFFKGFQEKN